MFRVVVTGSTGLLGGWLVAELERSGAEVIARGGPSRGERGLDLTDAAAVQDLVTDARPDVVIHTAALSAIGDCAQDPARARQVNVDATSNVALACERTGARLIHTSTDLVFDGEDAPYREDASPAPVSIYGRTKHEAESVALSTPRSVVVRLSLLFGPTRTERRGFFDQQLDALRARSPIRLFEDEWRTPLSLRAAAEGLVAIARSDLQGLVHLGGPERWSRHEMGVLLAQALGIEQPMIERTSRSSAPGEPRPRDVALDSSAFHRAFPRLATDSFVAECTRMRAAP